MNDASLLKTLPKFMMELYTTATLKEKTCIVNANCFIYHQDSFSSPEGWNVSFHFDGKQAGFGGDAIYSTSVLPCPFNGRISEVFHWNGWTYNNQDNLSLLTNSDL